jgi:hypothetical protein
MHLYIALAGVCGHSKTDRHHSVIRSIYHKNTEDREANLALVAQAGASPWANTSADTVANRISVSRTEVLVLFLYPGG